MYKLTALYNTLQHFISENKIIKGKKENNTYIRTNNAYTHIYTKNIKYMCHRRSSKNKEGKKHSWCTRCITCGEAIANS